METRLDTGEKISLLDFIPENTVVWMQDWAFTWERLEIQEEDLGLFLDLANTEREIAAGQRLADEQGPGGGRNLFGNRNRTTPHRPTSGSGEHHTRLEKKKPTDTHSPTPPQ